MRFSDMKLFQCACVWLLSVAATDVRAEWVDDWFDGGAYEDTNTKNPKGPETGISKVLRGGNWYYKAYYMRTTYRFNERPDQFNIWQGFRCARH